MQIEPVRLGLLVGFGIPTPASERMMTALESVVVRQSDESEGGQGFSQGFQLTFRAERGVALRNDFELVREPRLRPGCRVIVTVAVGARPRVLIDGIVSHHQLDPPGIGGDGSLVVTGQDISSAMDLVELAVGYPSMNHAAIAALVLARYAALGVVPSVVPPLRSFMPSPMERVPFQSGTDRTYLRQLASKHGYVFGILPGPRPGTTFGYWGPRVKIGLPQPALSVDQGPMTNVESIQFSANALAPEQVYGTHHLADSKLPVPFLTTLGTAIPLSRRPAVIFNQPFVRKSRMSHEGPSLIDTLERAQARTTTSSADVVTAQGTLDALRYRGILFAPGIVGLRGAGHSYDGHYYVRSVEHRIDRSSYKQNFSLSREGTGSLTETVRT